MKKRFLLLFLLIIGSTTYQLIACTCAGFDAFCEHINDEGFEEDGLVCLVQPIGNCQQAAYATNACQYKVVEVLYGSIYEGYGDFLNTDSTIWILEGGLHCLGTISVGDTTKQYLFAAQSVYIEGYIGYTTTLCAEDAIEIVDGEMIGYFYAKEQQPYMGIENDTLNFEAFRMQLDNCINDGIPNGIEIPTILDKAYHCYPNPVNTTLYIDCLNTSTAPTSLALYDVNGRQVWSGMINNSTIEIHTDHLADGVYYLVEGGAKGRFIDKVLVVGV